MRVIAYLYSDPLLETPPAADIWGWEVDRVYQDFAAVAQPSQRPQLEALLADSGVVEDCPLEATAPPDYVLLRRLDELGESLDEVSQRLSALEALGCVVLAVEQDYVSYRVREARPDDPNPDTVHTTWRTALMRLSSEIQQQQRSRRLRQGHARNRVKALPPPGKAPYGYRRGKDRYALDRTAAPVVKEFFEQFLLFGSLRRAVRVLEKKYGKRISVSTGKRWLTNPVYRGDLAYQDGGIVQNTHAAILSRDEAAQIDRLLRRNSRLAPRTASAPRSLAGLVKCQACQSGMKISRVTVPRQQKEYLYLAPTHCAQAPKCKSLAYEAVLAEAITAICRDLPNAIARLTQQMAPAGAPSPHPFNTQIQHKESALHQLPDLVTSGILDQDTADLRAYKLQTEIAQLQQRLAQLPPVNLQEIAQTVAIPQFWLDLSEPERRFFFREFLREIKVIRADGEWHIELDFIFFG
ncbi:MAG: recombinase family protein [Cyanobacteria bacterium Co-bin8]|nr:recombinase family protein [Cyanobacteria bacterium Co-bin8]